jgi:hypothetical protein
MSLKLKILIIIIGVFILGAIALSLSSSKKIKQENKQKTEQYSKERGAYDQKFSDLIQEFKSKNIISNPEEFLKAYNEVAQDPVRLLQLTDSTFRQNPQAGLKILSQLCVNFYASGKANDAIHADFSLLFYKDREKFLEGLTGDFEDEQINCLLTYVDFPPEVSEKADFNIDVERKKILDYLSNHRLKENSHVKRLIERFGSK